jgi:hypothetical protein
LKITDDYTKKRKEGGMFSDVSGTGTNISEESTDSIFMVPVDGVTFQKITLFIFKTLRASNLTKNRKLKGRR